MTPKEKAEQLIDKFYQTTPNEAWINEPIGIAKEYKAYNQAKDCALIMIEEILCNSTFLLSNGELYYWREVKQEIEKL
jgi:hypothetical protein